MHPLPSFLISSLTTELKKINSEGITYSFQREIQIGPNQDSKVLPIKGWEDTVQGRSPEG